MGYEKSKNFSLLLTNVTS